MVIFAGRVATSQLNQLLIENGRPDEHRLPYGVVSMAMERQGGLNASKRQQHQQHKTLAAFTRAVKE